MSPGMLRFMSVYFWVVCFRQLVITNRQQIIIKEKNQTGKATEKAIKRNSKAF